MPITLQERRVRSGREELVDLPAKAFVPAPLPPKLDWGELRQTHFDAYIEAQGALERLNGLHKRTGNASSLLRTLWMREAKLSSQIEDIETTAEDMVLAGAGRRLGVRAQGLESWNYVNALEHGIQSDLPLSNRLIREMHEKLLHGVRGADRRPGQFRDSPVYIGDPERGPRAARFVPPPPGSHLQECMQAFESFAHRNDPRIPPLMAVALMHYQFETIHPFRDGNGRIGRVLISRSLVKEDVLDHPVVYMSAYIHRHKKQYVDGLLNVSTEGAWSDWIGFMLRAIATQATDAVLRSEHLIHLRDLYTASIREIGLPTGVLALLDRLFAMPVVNASEVAESLQVSSPTAYSYISSLEGIGVLREYTGRQRNRDWLAPAIINVITAEDPSTVDSD